MLLKLRKIIKTPLFIGIAFVLILIGWYFYSNRGAGPTYQTVKAIRGDVVEEVSVTGRVEPVQSLDLGFEKGGKVSGVNFAVGNKVNVGSTLASLDASDISTQLAQAEANFNVQEVKIDNAKTALDAANKSVVDKVQDAYTKSDDAVRTKAGLLFSNSTSTYTQISFTLDNAVLKADLEKGKLDTENLLSAWKSSLETLTPSSDLQSYINLTKDNLDSVKSFLDKAALALNSLTATIYPTQGTLTAWRADISTARTNIATATTNLLTAESNWETAASNLDLQNTQLESEQANVDNYRTQLSKTVISSPISGTVTKVDVKVGETASVGIPIIHLISNNNFQVEANVPEADIAKIKLGNPVNITLDTYKDEVIFKAKVIAIDPAETMVEGVATYKVTIQFDENDTRVKSGMTANIDIRGRSQGNVIVLPQQAVTNKDGDKFVQILKGTEIKEVKVETGLRGADGNIAVLSGINEGDQVIISVK